MTAKLPIGVIVPFGPERWPQFRCAHRYFLAGLNDLAASGEVRLASYTVVLDGTVIQRPDPWEETDEAVSQLGGEFFIETLRTEGEPRPPNAAIRTGFQIVKHHGAELVVICYPEIVAPGWLLEFVASEHVPGHRITAPVYAVSERRTRLLLDQLRSPDDKMDSFEFEEWVHSDPDFAVTVGPLGLRNIDADQNIHHLNFTAAMVDEWEGLGLLPDTDDYAMNENWLREREVEQNRLPTTLSCPVYHLWHPKVLHGGAPRSARIARVLGGLR